MSWSILGKIKNKSSRGSEVSTAEGVSQNLQPVPNLVKPAPPVVAAKPAGPINSNTPQVNPSIPPPPSKKGFPKIVLLPLIILPLIILGLLIFKNFYPSKNGEVGKKGEITWWGLNEESIVAPLIKEYEEEYPEIKITYIKQSTQDYRERLTNALAKGEGPDMIHFHNTWVPMFKSDLAVLPNSVMDQQEFANTYYPIAVSDLTTDEGVVGIPLEYDAITLYINEDIFNLAIKSPPESWDELKIVAQEMTQRSGDQIIQAGVAAGLTENVDHWQEILALLMMQNKANLAKPTGILAEDAMTFYVQLAVKDKDWDTTLPSSTIAFARGKVAMYFGPVYRADEIRKENPNLRFKTVFVPQLLKDNPNEPDVSYATYWVEGVWNKSVNKDAAWDFLKFLSERESLEKMHSNAQNIGLFGAPYPRRDMALLLKEDPIVGSIMAPAPFAKGWYLADNTFDGPTGINSQIAELFETALGGVGVKGGADKVSGTLANELDTLLAKYGIAVE